MLISKTLALQPMHGYGIAGRIEQTSNRVFKPNAGSLFVGFQRLQRKGRISRKESHGKPQASEVPRL
jgi:DNA-binding PadR family transcriptional regulator